MNVIKPVVLFVVPPVVYVSTTVSVAVVIPVMCPKLSNRISWIYVRPLLSDELAADTDG